MSNWIERKSKEAIVNIMTNLGEGSRAIVYGYRGTDEIDHFFNVVNQMGKIKFLEGQSGGAANLNSNFKTFLLLRRDDVR